LDYLGDYLEGQDENLTPSVNIAENRKRYKIEMGLPGFNRENFQIDLEQDCLIVRGVSEKEDNQVKEEYMHQEFNTESFEKSFRLPQIIDQEKISARFVDRLLEIELPKRENTERGTRQIEVS